MLPRIAQQHFPIIKYNYILHTLFAEKIYLEKENGKPLLQQIQATTKTKIKRKIGHTIFYNAVLINIRVPHTLKSPL